jgi:hypothetical protein
MTPGMRPPKLGESASAIVSVLIVTALLCIVLACLCQGVRLDRRTSSVTAGNEQARLAAQSAVAAAMARLSVCTATNPAFLTGLLPREGAADVTVIAGGNLRDEDQAVPLFSCDAGGLANYPKLPSDYARIQLSKSLSTNPSESVDLNSPGFARSLAVTNALPGGLIAPEGRFPAPWQRITDSAGAVVARYAYLMLDESACLNPLLHKGRGRNDPSSWDEGPETLPMTNASGSLLTEEENEQLHKLAGTLPTLESWEEAFPGRGRFLEVEAFLTRDPCLLPDIIPAGYPEKGLPKYNINDLATNPAWGKTGWDRATNIAAVIDRNLPEFKSRDPSLKGAERILYLQRLACSIVDYITPATGPTGPSGDLPLGRDLVPYVTQVAERCALTSVSSNSATIESRYYVEVWNPTTMEIPSCGGADLVISNRALVSFGDGIVAPFETYRGHVGTVPAIRPNEFALVAFPPQLQTWISPSAAKLTTNPFPQWGNGPQGNADTLHHYSFALSWNGRIVDRSHPGGLSQGDPPGGLMHFGKTLSNALPTWQCMIVPTQSARSGEEDQEEADEALSPGRYRAVGDPRQNLFTSYIWGKPYTNYVGNTHWKGINPAGIASSGGIMDPKDTWGARDPVPVNPPAGTRPAAITQTPDLIPSPYVAARDGILAPSWIRKGAMKSLGELGNIYDPAQAEDSGDAPKCGGSGRKNVFGGGGGRTLRFGQPEFRFPDPKLSWDIPGKRGVDLADLFTVADKGRIPGASNPSTNPGIPGRINLNTAPREVLTALFTGVAATSDRRFTNSVLRPQAVENLADLIESNRPFNRLSDLCILATNLVNADSYQPSLSRNIPGSSPQVANVFDRAREEAFSRVIGHCCLQSRTYRVVAVGESLDPAGHTVSTAVTEGIIRLRPDEQGTLVPSLHDVRWH